MREPLLQRVKRFFFSSRRRHTRSYGDWSSDVCSSDLDSAAIEGSCKTLAIAAESRRGHRRRHPCEGTAHDRPAARSEERRVGKECRSRWWPDESKKQN